jgi:hypothetical protein
MKVRVTQNTQGKIPAIRLYRYLTGYGLRESKDFIEALFESSSRVGTVAIYTTYTSAAMDDINKMIQEMIVCYGSNINIPSVELVDESEKTPTADISIDVYRNADETVRIRVRGYRTEADVAVPNYKVADIVSFFIENTLNP